MIPPMTAAQRKLFARELMGVSEVAEYLGVLRSNFLRDYASREDFPKPIIRLRCGPIWVESDLLNWKRRKNFL